MALNFFQARGEACCLRNFFAPSPQPPEEMQAATLRSTPAAYTATAAPKLCPTTPMRLGSISGRSEEHTSELQSRGHLVCRLLLECSAAHRDLPSFPTRRSSDLSAELLPGAG